MHEPTLQELLINSRRISANLETELRTIRRTPISEGDLFSLEEQADSPLQWVLVRLETERALLVPADTAPFVSDADVQVREAIGGAPLVIRAGMREVVSPTLLRGEQRSGRLRTEDLEILRHEMSAASSAGGSAWAPRDAITERETKRWIDEVVAPACEALRTRGRVMTPVALETERESTPIRGSWLAAAVLSLLVLGLSIVVLRDRSSFERRFAEQEVRYQQKLEGLGRDLQSGASTVTLNAAVVLLTPWESERGAPDATTLPGDASRLTVVLHLDPLALFDSYAARIASVTDGTEVWSGGGLERNGELWLALELPRVLLPDDEYRLSLAGREGSQSVPAGEYRLRLARPGQRQSP